MKAIRLHEAGLDKLVYEEVAKPSINDDQILVKIYASSVNQIDWKRVSGKSSPGFLPEFPWIPGMDFAGQIERVGNNVEDFKVGDEVFGCNDGNTYAEYVAAKPEKTAAKPENISYVDGAAAAYVSQTAWQAVNEYGKLMKGDRVLIHGAAGAVGAFAVQFARLVGADIYATAAGRDAAFVKSLGADVVIDYHKDDFTRIASNMDLVVDLVGGDTYKDSYKVLKPGGKLVSLTSPADEKTAEQYGVMAIHMVVAPNAQDLRKIATLLSNDQVKTDVAAVFWLKDAQCAWDYVLNPDASEKVHGKVVIQVL